jgi:hypothetical protein
MPNLMINDQAFECKKLQKREDENLIPLKNEEDLLVILEIKFFNIFYLKKLLTQFPNIILRN